MVVHVMSTSAFPPTPIANAGKFSPNRDFTVKPSRAQN